MTDPAALTDKDREALLRWRLVLGPEAERASEAMSLAGLGAAAASLELGEGEAAELDEALSFVYGEGDRRRGGGPYVPRWLSAVRRFFNQDTVALLQKDAVEK